MIKQIFSGWTILVALGISIVAAYYSIVGLTAIFAASVIPIIIMGTALELAKITTAVWLHTFWNSTASLMKTYLTIATCILMLITSMGIFGFLSKAHIEQNANGIDLTAQIERLDDNINRQQLIISRANAKILQFDNKTASQDNSIRDKINTQQLLITQIETRLARDISTQNDIINRESGTTLLNELDRIKTLRNRLEIAITENDVKTIQRIIGSNPDGAFGPDTTKKLKTYQINLDNQISEIATKIETQQNNTTIITAQEKIQELQSSANKEIQRINDAINELRDQSLLVIVADNTNDIAEQETVIQTANDQIDAYTKTKFDLNSQLRKLEVEVGPVKYLAELIYGNATQDLLERAVRWVIIMLVIVFDPLAIVLILAGVSTFKQSTNINNATEQHIDNDTKNKYNKTLLKLPTQILPTQVEPIEPVQQSPVTTNSPTGFIGKPVPTGTATIFGRKNKE